MDEPPLDDPRWCPMQTAIVLRTRQTGTERLAINDLEQDMAGGKLRSMRRHIVNGSRECVSAEFWTTCQGRWIGSRRIGCDAEDWLFYVWQPDFDRPYAPTDRDNDSDAPPPVKSGPKPHGDWPTLIAQWLIEVALDNPQKLQKPQNIDELAIEAELFLRNQNKWVPKDIKVIRARIRELLTPVRR